MKQEQIKDILINLRAEGNLRELKKTRYRGKYLSYNGKTYLDMSSNDYLGLMEDKSYAHLGLGGAALQWEFFNQFGDNPPFMMSNPSSRLMSGNNLEYDTLELALSDLYPGRKKALVLSSGYSTNTGALQALTSKGDLLIADKFSHASIMDGLRLCNADFLRFRHNDMEHLEEIIIKTRSRYNNVWIVTESLFSMDGDYAPLQKIVELKHKYDLQIYLDEAHAFGIYGKNGAGLAHELGLAPEIDVIAATLGKAIASTGGFLMTDTHTREMLVNRMRTLIYSTAIPTINLMWSLFVINRLQDFEPRRRHLQQIAQQLTGSETATQIVPIITGDNLRAIKMARRFREAGFWVTAIRSPTVPKGKERVRVSLNSAITPEEIDKFKTVWDKIALSL